MKNGAWRVLLINLLTIIVLLVVIEVLSRAILNKVYNRSFDRSLIVENKYFNSDGLKANASGTVWGKNFHTDEFGGRKNAGAGSKKKKCLYIGDSVTEGVGVEDSATFASIVSAEKQTACSLINYSLIGYSTDDYLNVVKSEVSKGDSGIGSVTIFLCLNDVYGKAKTKDLPVMGRKNLIGRVTSFLHSHYATYKLLRLIAFQNANRYFHYDLQFYKSEDPHFTESMNYVRQCDSICKTNRIKFNTVIIPYRSQIVGRDRANRIPQTLVKDFCNQHQIGFSDAIDYLSKQQNPKSLYLFADEIHFSEAGHRAIAGFLLSSMPVTQ